MVIHKVSAEGAERAEVLEWDYFWCEHHALQKHRQSISTLTHKHILYVLREIFKPLNLKCRISEIPQHEFDITGLFVLMTGPII